MFFGEDLTTIALIVMIALSVGGVIFAIIYPMLAGSASANRIKAVAGTAPRKEGSSLRSRMMEDSKDSRRNKIQESLSLINEKEKKKKRKSIRVKIQQAGYDFTTRTFFLASIVLGVVLTAAAMIFGAPLIVVGLVAFAGTLGLPRWILGNMVKRRQNKFLHDFADAIDVLVRGLKSGLPVTEAMKIISTEQGPPVGPEFLEVIEGQRIGIPIDQGIERMVERVPLAEVNFLAIVMTIQSKTGGNLSEALANLSRVLRDRKKMKAKVQAVSQEAKSSAAIIGSLPFCIVGVMYFVNPNYLSPLLHTNIGHILLTCSGLWMTTGVLVMRKMIAFEI